MGLGEGDGGEYLWRGEERECDRDVERRERRGEDNGA